MGKGLEFYCLILCIADVQSHCPVEILEKLITC